MSILLRSNLFFVLQNVLFPNNIKSFICSFFYLFLYIILYFAVVIDVDEHTKWIKLNVNQVGYYRVNYGDEWQTIAELLRYHPTVTIYFVI